MRTTTPCERVPPGPLADRIAACFARAGQPAPDAWFIALERFGQHNALLSGLRTPWGRPRQALFLSRSLSEKLGDAETESVILHETSHAARGHVPRRILALWALTAAPIAASLLAAAAARGAGLRAPGWTFAAVWTAFYVTALRFRARAYRRQEFEADADAVTRFGAEPAVFASALRKLAAINFIETKRNLPLVVSHPSIDVRIAEFERRAARWRAGDPAAGGEVDEKLPAVERVWNAALALGLAWCVWHLAFVAVPAHRLRRAAARGDAARVAALLAGGADPDRPDSLFDGASPLTAAVQSNCVACAQTLLNKGAAPDGSAGSVPIEDAARYGRAELVRRLAAAGADPNRRDAAGDTPLVAALDENAPADALAALLAAGADPNLAGSRGRTPLRAAADSCAPDAARLLLAEGADASATNELGRTARDVAEDEECGAVAAVVDAASARH